MKFGPAALRKPASGMSGVRRREADRAPIGAATSISFRCPTAKAIAKEERATVVEATESAQATGRPGAGGRKICLDCTRLGAATRERVPQASTKFEDPRADHGRGRTAQAEVSSLLAFDELSKFLRTGSPVNR
jgi:hypothetical protein